MKAIADVFTRECIIQCGYVIYDVATLAYCSFFINLDTNFV